jgi:hypothetical protein
VLHFEKPCGNRQRSFKLRLDLKILLWKKINILAKGRPRKKLLAMFAVVLQQEHKKLAAKTPNKAQKTKIIMDESSDSNDEDMYVDQMSISKTDNGDSPSKKLTEEDKTYQSRIENLGAITNEEWNKPVVTHYSSKEFYDYSNECYVIAATLFNPNKKP